MRTYVRALQLCVVRVSVCVCVGACASVDVLLFEIIDAMLLRSLSA